LRKRPDWSRPLPRPIVIPEIMTIKTLADVRKLLGHIPKEARQASTWQHVQTQLNAAAKGGDVRDVSVVLIWPCETWIGTASATDFYGRRYRSTPRTGVVSTVMNMR